MIEFDGDGIPENVLIFSPHPDDSELGCGGTVSKWASMGSEVNYVICTNGDKGSNDPDIDSVNLACLRSDETKNACKVLGVKNLIELGYEDGFLEDTGEKAESSATGGRPAKLYRAGAASSISPPIRRN